jgi:hypothetical protein
MTKTVRVGGSVSDDSTQPVSQITFQPRWNLQQPAFVTPYTPDISLGNYIRMILTGSIATLNAPINGLAANTPGSGMELMLEWVQDGVGGRTVYGGANAIYKLTGTGIVVFATTLSTVTLDRYVYDSVTPGWRLYSRVTGQT